MQKMFVALLIFVGMAGMLRAQQQSTGSYQGSGSSSSSAQDKGSSSRSRSGSDSSSASETSNYRSAQGVLTKVDTAKHMISIKTTAGKEMEFSYNQDTQVEGTGASVEGLAKMSGNKLTVQYRPEGGTNTAVTITQESGGSSSSGSSKQSAPRSSQSQPANPDSR